MRPGRRIQCGNAARCGNRREGAQRHPAGRCGGPRRARSARGFRPAALGAQALVPLHRRQRRSARPALAPTRLVRRGRPRSPGDAATRRKRSPGRQRFHRLLRAARTGPHLGARPCSRAGWHREGGALLFDIEADAFLPQMVRRITGALVRVGRGAANSGGIRPPARSRQQPGASAPYGPAPGPLPPARVVRRGIPAMNTTVRMKASADLQGLARHRRRRPPAGPRRDRGRHPPPRQAQADLSNPTSMTATSSSSSTPRRCGSPASKAEQTKLLPPLRLPGRPQGAHLHRTARHASRTASSNRRSGACSPKGSLGEAMLQAPQGLRRARTTRTSRRSPAAKRPTRPAPLNSPSWPTSPTGRRACARSASRTGMRRRSSSRRRALAALAAEARAARQAARVAAEARRKPVVAADETVAEAPRARRGRPGVRGRHPEVDLAPAETAAEATTEAPAKKPARRRAPPRPNRAEE